MYIVFITSFFGIQHHVLFVYSYHCNYFIPNTFYFSFTFHWSLTICYLLFHTQSILVFFLIHTPERNTIFITLGIHDNILYIFNIVSFSGQVPFKPWIITHTCLAYYLGALVGLIFGSSGTQTMFAQSQDFAYNMLCSLYALDIMFSGFVQVPGRSPPLPVGHLGFNKPLCPFLFHHVLSALFQSHHSLAFSTMCCLFTHTNVIILFPIFFAFPSQFHWSLTMCYLLFHTQSILFFFQIHTPDCNPIFLTLGIHYNIFYIFNIVSFSGQVPFKTWIITHTCLAYCEVPPRGWGVEITRKHTSCRK